MSAATAMAAVTAACLEGVHVLDIASFDILRELPSNLVEGFRVFQLSNIVVINLLASL